MTLALLVLALCAPSFLGAKDLLENAFFKALAGTWKGEGQMTVGDQASRALRNRIQAGFGEEGAVFTIQGALASADNDGKFTEEPMAYHWEFRPSKKKEGMIDGRLFIHNEEKETADYEVSIDEAGKTARLVQVPGKPEEDRIELTKQVAGQDYTVQIAVRKPSGELAASGKLQFKREP